MRSAAGLLLTVLALAFSSINAQDNTPANNQDTVIYIWEDSLRAYETKPRFGIYGRYAQNLHLSDFNKLPGVPSCCPQFTFGTDPGFEAGILAQFHINYDFMIGARTGFGIYNGYFAETEPEEFIIDGIPYNGAFEHRLEAMLSAVSLDLEGYYRLTGSLFANAGLKAAFMLQKEYDQIEEIVDPSDRGTFNETGLTTRNDTEGTINEASSIIMGANAGISYELPLNKSRSLIMAPELNYTFFFTPVVSGQTWNIHRITGGLAIKYKQPPPPPPPPPPPLPAPMPELFYPGEPPTLAVEVEAVQVDSLGRVSDDFNIRIEDFVSLNMRPLLNYVFFDENSAELPDRYELYNPGQTGQFNFKMLQEKNALETYYHVLNIIGYRLRENPGVNITLVGTNSDTGQEKDNLELSRQRAESVADYLYDVWGISRERMRVEARKLPRQATKSDDPGDEAENRRVEIISSDNNITEPVITTDTLRVLSAVKVRFLPKTVSEAGIKEWSLKATQSDKTLVSYSGKGDVPQRLEWDLENKDQNVPRRAGHVDFSLSVTDSLGQTVSTKRNWIPVEQLTIEKKRLEHKTDREFEYYSLILFDFGSTKLEKEHRSVVDFVKNRVTPEADVFIYGYTDRMGEEAINKRISRERAQAVAKRLDIPGAVVKGVGEAELLYDNSLPEGRFYCRTVTITIETPVREETE
ncbi:MAG: OmpA family protein [Candidatus Kapaibacterium sp.]